MRRLVVITVGKTHSGKTTFARELERELNNSIVIDQDNHAEFINSYYKSLQPTKGTNTLKHAISKLIVDYAKEQTNFHLIISNSNRRKKDRRYLLEELFPKSEFVRILVHFDIPDSILHTRVENSTRNTNIFRGPYTSFVEVLKRQHAESTSEDVEEDEADYLFVIKDNKKTSTIRKSIIKIAQSLD